MINFLSLSTLLLGVICYQSTLVKAESENCLRVLLPRIRTCDSEIAQIDLFCMHGYQNINKICRTIDSDDCATKYHAFTRQCQGKRDVFAKKCQSVYDHYTKECGEIPANYYQKVGPDSFRCLKVLTPAVETCDKRIFVIDNDCRQAYEKLDKICKGVDTDECGLKYKNLKDTCGNKRDTFFKECNPTYNAYSTECKGTPSVYPPPTGPDSDRCLKDLLPKIQKCDKTVAEIDKFCNEQFNIVDSLCKGKDTDECGVKFQNVKMICEGKRSMYKANCGPIYGAFKKECKEPEPKRPLTGPESDRCLKELVPAVQTCDQEAQRIDRFCSEGFKGIEKECAGKDSTECDLKFKNFNVTCQTKLNRYKTVFEVINNAYKRECTDQKNVPPIVVPGVDLDSCANALIRAVIICDEDIYHIDKDCNEGFDRIDKFCKSVKSVPCGLKYMSWTDSCKEKRDNFWGTCGVIYKAYLTEYAKFYNSNSKSVKQKRSVTSVKSMKSVQAKKVSIKKTAVPSVLLQHSTRVGLSLNKCSKRIILEVSACDTRTTKIDVNCSGEYKSVYTVCSKSNPLITCGGNYYKVTDTCKVRRRNLHESCDEVYDEYHEKCEGKCIPVKKN